MKQHVDNATQRLFIHIPKNAGVTIRESPLLANRIVEAGKGDIYVSNEYKNKLLQTMAAIGDHHGFAHARWVDIHPNITSKYQAFAVIRNPWDRVVSRYFFAKKVIEVEKKEPIGKHRIDSFESFLEERFLWGGKEFMWHRAIRGWYPAFDYVTDQAGNLKCDMLRFDKLNTEVCAYFNVPEMTRARNVTNLNTGTYRDLYTKETIQIVADWYKKDIDFWGFDFDTGPTKNYWSLNVNS